MVAAGAAAGVGEGAVPAAEFVVADLAGVADAAIVGDADGLAAGDDVALDADAGAGLVVGVDGGFDIEAALALSA